MSGNIYWLASYPKSGNTWMRILLTNYLRDGDEPADINNLDGGPIASARLPQSTASFFRRGKANSWQAELSGARREIDHRSQNNHGTIWLFDRDMLKVTDTSEVPVTLPSSLICFQLRDDVFALELPEPVNVITSRPPSTVSALGFPPAWRPTTRDNPLCSATSHQGSAHGTISFSPCPSR